MRDLDLWVASHRFLELRGQISSATMLLSQANEDVQASRHALVAKEASVEADRVSLQQMGSELERGQGRAYELDNLVRQLEGLIRQQQDRQAALLERKELATRELHQLEEQRDGLDQEASTVRLSLSELESLEAEAGKLLAEVEAELQSRKNTAEEAEAALQNARSRLAQGHARVVGAEAVLDGYSARREDIRGRLERLQEELQTLATHEVEFRQQSGELEARMVGLRSGKSATAERQTEIETSLSTGKDALHQADEEVDALREQLAVTSSRLRSLNEIHERFEGVGAGAQAVMTGYADASGDAGGDAGGSGLVGLVADRLECAAEHTRALGAALGGSLEYLLVHDTDAALRAAEYLAREEKGRATFLPRSPSGPVRIVPPFPTGLGIVGPHARDRCPASPSGLSRQAGHARRSGAAQRRRCRRRRQRRIRSPSAPTEARDPRAPRGRRIRGCRARACHRESGPASGRYRRRSGGHRLDEGPGPRRRARNPRRRAGSASRRPGASPPRGAAPGNRQRRDGRPRVFVPNRCR
ncbi:MAG: hypothetical protein JRD94_05680 [Deltaproteobacteria bacterium]|nr:hypothetical protein [Deltaproteobacteria bacterium]